MILDFHTHQFPDVLAPRAMAVLTENCSGAGLKPTTDGTCAGAERLLRAAGVDGAVVCNIATSARQQKNVNRFAMETKRLHPFFFPLGSLHPEGDAPEEVLDDLGQAGIGGIKIHPDYVGIEIDDARFDRIFALCEQQGFFVVTHAGLDPVSPNHIHATPEKIRTVLRRYPRMKLIAAHLGGLRMAKEVRDMLVGEDIWFDTSLSAQRQDEKELLLSILKEHRPDRLLFGSDTPWSDPAAEVTFLRDAVRDEELRDRIFCRNAQELLK